MKLHFLFIILLLSGCNNIVGEVLVQEAINVMTDAGDDIKVELTGNQNEAEISYYHIDEETEESFNNEQLNELINQNLEYNKQNILLPYTEECTLEYEHKIFIQIRLLSKKATLHMKIWKNNKLVKERKINYFNSPYRTSIN